MPTEHSGLPQTDPQMEDFFKHVEDSDEVHSLIKKAGLPIDSLQFLGLRYGENLTLREIAERMEKSDDQVRALHQRTQEKLNRARIDLSRIFPHTNKDDTP